MHTSCILTAGSHSSLVVAWVVGPLFVPCGATCLSGFVLVTNRSCLPSTAAGGAVNPEGLCKTVALGPVLGGKACVPINSTASGMDFETGFTIRDNFGSLLAFLDEDCPEFSVLDNTAPSCGPNPPPSTCIPHMRALRAQLALTAGYIASGWISAAVSPSGGACPTKLRNMELCTQLQA